MATAMYRRAGVVEFHDSDEMIKAAIALSCQPVPSGKRIGIITNTGGPGIQAVDEAVEQGLTLARWSEAGRERLKQSLYAEASLGNPVDVVATAGADHYFAATDTLLKEEGVDCVLVFFVTAPFVDLDAIAARLKEATTGAQKPVVVVIETIDKWGGLIRKLRESGIPVYEFAEDGSRALAAMARYGAYRERRRPAWSSTRAPRAGSSSGTGARTATCRRSTRSRCSRPTGSRSRSSPRSRTPMTCRAWRSGWASPACSSSTRPSSCTRPRPGE